MKSLSNLIGPGINTPLCDLYAAIEERRCLTGKLQIESLTMMDKRREGEGASENLMQLEQCSKQVQQLTKELLYIQIEISRIGRLNNEK